MSRFEKGTVVISVDDGRKDAYPLFKEILQKYSIPATFNIVTAWIDADGSITRGELEEMSRSPLVEIAAHGHSHKNTDEDIVKGKDLLCEWLGIDGKLGFASPGSGMKTAFVRENSAKFDAMGFLYIRSAGTDDAPTEKHLAVRSRAVERGFDGYVVKNTAELVYEFSGKFVNSVVVCNEHTAGQLKALTEFAIEENACVVFMFHSVVKADAENHGNIWSYDFDKFNEFAEYLCQKRADGALDIMTTAEAYLRGLAE